MLLTNEPQQLQDLFDNGGVWAYPTEAVFGLGCNPDDEAAVNHLLAIKQRPIAKGLILIASDFSQVEKYLKPLSEAQQALTKPSATTYIFPALESTPAWLTGNFDSLAVRITKHSIAKKMCEALDSAIVSTSANPGGYPPAKFEDEVLQYFSHNNNQYKVQYKVDALLKGKVGDSAKPSVIRDSISGKIIRA